MSRKLRATHILMLILALVVGPVLITQLVPSESRHYDGVSLGDTVYSEVSFQNNVQGLKMGGMLFVPEGSGPFPAAVVIHGSGTSSRQNRWYLTLAHYLQQNGIAVLLPDKRGSEQSEGDWRIADFEDLATDTLAAIEFMQQQDLLPVSGVGIVGMSQGGWIAPIVARDSDDLAFVVNMVGSAVTPNEQLLYEENHNIQQMGFLPGISYAIAMASSAHIRHIRRPDFYDRVGAYDPVPLWNAMSMDVLVLYGRDDTNVPSEESAARLDSLGKENIEVRVFEGSGHALQDPVGKGNNLIRREALDAITSLIKQN